MKKLRSERYIHICVTFFDLCEFSLRDISCILIRGVEFVGFMTKSIGVKIKDKLKFGKVEKFIQLKRKHFHESILFDICSCFCV